VSPQKAKQFAFCPKKLTKEQKELLERLKNEGI